MPPLYASFRKIQLKLNKLCRKKKLKQWLFSKGCNSKINDPILPFFEIIRDFVHVHLICKFQEEIKKVNEGDEKFKQMFSSAIKGT